MSRRRKSRVELDAERIIREANEPEPELEEKPGPPDVVSHDEHFNLIGWIKKHAWIQKKGGGTIPFDKWTKSQKKVAALIVKTWAKGEPAILAILKTRQRGITTVIRAIIFALTRHHQHTTGVLVAQTRETSKRIFREVRTLYKNLGETERNRLPLERGEAGVLELRYDHPWMSQMLVCVGEEGARSPMVSYAHFSECDLIPNFKAIWSAMLAAVPKKEVNYKTLVVAETTVKGKRQFHSLWKQAKDPKSGIMPVFIGLKEDETARIPLEPGEVLDLDDEEQEYMEKWDVEPEQMKWVQRALRTECQGDWNLFNSEYPISEEVAFGSGVGDYFKATRIAEDIDAAPSPIFRGTVEFPSDTAFKVVLKRMASGPLTIWEHYIPPKEGEVAIQYAIGGDVGHGYGRDFIVLYVKRCDTKQTIAQYRTNAVEPGVAAISAYCLGALYGFPLMGIENNGPGIAMLTVLRDGSPDCPQMGGGYPYLYFHKAYDRVAKEFTVRMGFATTGKSKTAVIEAFRTAFNMGRCREVSKEALMEMDGFFYDSLTHESVQVNQDPLSKLYHDDCVMALAITYAMTNEVLEGSYCPNPEISYEGLIQ